MKECSTAYKNGPSAFLSFPYERSSLFLSRMKIPWHSPSLVAWWKVPYDKTHQLQEKIKQEKKKKRQTKHPALFDLVLNGKFWTL